MSRYCTHIVKCSDANIRQTQHIANMRLCFSLCKVYVGPELLTYWVKHWSWMLCLCLCVMLMYLPAQWACVLSFFSSSWCRNRNYPERSTQDIIACAVVSPAAPSRSISPAPLGLASATIYTTYTSQSHISHRIQPTHIQIQFCLENTRTMLNNILNIWWRIWPTK